MKRRTRAQVPEDIVCHHGAHLVRVQEALQGFRAKHGDWPSVLRLSDEALAQLRDHHLTPLGFELLTKKVTLMPSNDPRLVAEDTARRIFDYGAEGWSHPDAEARVDEWLWGMRLY